MKSLILFPYTFVLMNWAAVLGLYCFFRGERDGWSGYKEAGLLLKDNDFHEPGDRDREYSDAA